MRRNFARLIFALLIGLAANARAGEILRYHPLTLDSGGKIIPWFEPEEKAFDNYLTKCWEWVLAAPLDSNGLPISYLYCAWKPGDPPAIDPNWENDVGEKIPNWVESARLYYQYSGDKRPLDYVKRLVDYSLDHGQTPASHVWPDFPVGTSNAGDTEFRGFTERWKLWDCHLDLAADIGFALYRMYQLYGDSRYLDKAIQVADLLTEHIVPGTAEESPWPYVVNSETGENHSRYASSWDGALILFDLLIADGQGRVEDYRRTNQILKNWLLRYPMRNGKWVDGHSDTYFDGTNNLSTTCASDMCLYLLQNPGWDPDFMEDVPRLLEWTVDNFVNPPTPDSLSGEYYGAFVPAEQTMYAYRMGYQAARLGAQYALWYEVTGDESYRDRAYRCLSYNTYMMQDSGQSSDGPTDEVGWWWSDCYGEATRMYYYAMAAVPDWAPPDLNHLLRSSSVVNSISYSSDRITYATCDSAAMELFRLTRTPTLVIAGGLAIPYLDSLSRQGWTFDKLTGVFKVKHTNSPLVELRFDSPGGSVRVDGADREQIIDGFGVNANHRSWNDGELQPVLDALINQAGMTLFRVVYDNAEWETVNDNADPNVMNREFYDTLYTSPRFQPLWEMCEYLKKHVPGDGIFLNFMGPGPEWMGGGKLTAGMEEEWAEEISSLLLYANNSRGLKFNLVAPNNEPNIDNEGISVDAPQYARCLHALARHLDENGLRNMRFVAPDLAGGGTDYLAELVRDPVIMDKLAYFGMHSYSEYGHGSKGVSDFIAKSDYPDRRFWMTEYNVWLSGADYGERGSYGWTFCRGSAKYLLDHLAQGASAGIVWEGYDSYYKHPPACWSFWGLFEIVDENAAEKIYRPRKNFFTLAQISRFVRPGSYRIKLENDSGAFSPLLAFFNPEQNQLTIVGINNAATEAGLHVELASLPLVSDLELYYTSSVENLVKAETISVENGEFTAKIPADCVFTLSSNFH